MGFSVDKLKLPSKTKFPYIGLKKFKSRFNLFINERSFCEGVYNYLKVIISNVP